MATASQDPPAAHTGRVIAIMTVFRPGDAVIANARAALAQTDDLIVVDDGSGDAADAALAAIEDSGATVMRSRVNAGIAAALNAGVAATASLDHDYILFLDQDSSIPPGFVAALVDAHQASGGVPAGAAGAAPEYFGTVQQGRTLRDGAVVPMPIQSGMLLHRDALRLVGAMREDLFIDLVDFDYALRVADAGLRIVSAPGVVLPHRLGHQVGLRLLGLPLGPQHGFTVSAPFRYYYRSRNRVLIWRAHWRRHLVRMVGDLLLDLRHAIIVLAAVQHRRALLGVMRAGWRDGIRGRGGAIPTSVRDRAQSIEWRYPQ